MNGIINVYKEKGYTSFDVVAKLRKILKMKRIGHTGTLDPDAEGVLPVCIGNATKLSELLLNKNKIYEATIKLGIVTDTQDITGIIVEEKPLFISREAFIKAVMSFVGEYNQLPPMYSAIKVNGRKLYELAREGKEVLRTKRMVMIHSIDIADIFEENGYVSEAVIKVSCSKGTYIRTLCHDIGIKLSQGACMKSLLRTKSGDFLLSDSIRLKDIENITQNGNLNEILIPVEKILPYRIIIVNEENNKYLINGNKLRQEQVTIYDNNISTPNDSELFKVYDNNNNFAAIYGYDHVELIYRPYKMFL